MLTTDYLSPELEQLSYATRKHIQWKWNEDVGEDKYVLVSEALHVEFVGEAIEGIIWSFRSCPSPASDHRLNWTRYVHHVFLLAGRALKLSRLISRSDRELGYCNVEFIQAVRLLVSRVTVPNTREEKPYNY